MKILAPFSIRAFVQRLRLDCLARFLKQKPPLLPIIEEIIREEGPMSIERYMEITLQHPEHGYYRSGDPIGSAEDFSTAPEVSQMFGEMIGLWGHAAWQNMGSPEAFTLLELGPGHGTLLSDFLRFTEPLSDFQKALKVHLFESNATLREIQRQKLPKYNPVHIESLDHLPALPVLVIANEFFDNIPVRQFVKTADGWREILVALKKGALAPVEGEEIYSSPPDLFFKESLKGRETGWVHEISDPSRRIIKNLAAHIVQHGGAGVVIDYGYVLPSGTGTLDAWSQSRPTNILACPGKTDVTAGVDFNALRRSAEEQGARVTDPVGQGEFLFGRGLAARAEFLKSRANDVSKKKIEDSFRQLVSPLQMGEEWMAMEFTAK